MTTQSERAEPTVIRPSGRAVSRIVSGQALILDAAHDEIRQLNTVGSFLWSLLLASPQTETELLDEMMSEFEVTREVASADLAEFLGELESMSLIVRS